MWRRIAPKKVQINVTLERKYLFWNNIKRILEATNSQLDLTLEREPNIELLEQTENSKTAVTEKLTLKTRAKENVPRYISLEGYHSLGKSSILSNCVNG